MYNSLPCIKIVLLVLLAVLHHSTTAYIGQITWDWDDAGSGNEDQEQAAIPIYEKSWVTPPFLLVGESLKGNDYDEPLSRSERGGPCNFDQNCGPKEFCHEHYKYCQKKKYPGEKCRRTENCVFNAICMWGECKKEKKPRVLGSSCKQHLDCNQGLCCAKRNGEKICKPYLREGQNCTVHKGGLWYAYNNECSCGYGLVCERYGWKDAMKTDPLMKCVKLIA